MRSHSSRLLVTMLPPPLIPALLNNKGWVDLRRSSGWRHGLTPTAYRKSRPLISTFPSSVNWRPAQLPLGDAFEPGPLETISLAAALGGGYSLASAPQPRIMHRVRAFLAAPA